MVFRDEDVTHVDGEVNPGSDLSTISTELVLADLQTVEKARHPRRGDHRIRLHGAAPRAPISRRIAGDKGNSRMNTLSSGVARTVRPGRSLLALALGAVLVTGLALVPGGQRADATSPGVNGLIYYEQGGHIWSISPTTGVKKKVVPKKHFPYLGAPVPSPDGRKIAFSYAGGSDIYVKNLVTGKYKNVTGRAGDAKSLSFIEAPAWSPDGKKLVFEADRQQKTRLYTIKVDGTGLKQLVLFGDYLAGDISPDWSSTGVIVFAHQGSLYTIPPNGGDAIEVASPDEYEGRGFYLPSWSPDGTRIAAEIDGTSFADGGIMIVTPSAPLGAGKYNYLTGDEDNQHSEVIEDPAWSPDGTKIVYYGHWSPEDADLEDYDLWSIDVADPEGPPTDLNARSEFGADTYHPSWAPATG